jgi:hypothetical protein
MRVQNEANADIVRLSDAFRAQCSSSGARLRAGDAATTPAATSAATDGVDGGTTVDAERLVHLWRDKTFALLVQAKSASHAHSAEVRSLRTTQADLQAQLDASVQGRVLAERSVTALRAQLASMQHDRAHEAHMLQQGQMLHSAAVSAQAQVHRDVAAVHHMLGVYDEHARRTEEALRRRVEGKLGALTRRLAFAADRARVARQMRSNGGSSSSSSRGVAHYDAADGDGGAAAALEDGQAGADEGDGVTGGWVDVASDARADAQLHDDDGHGSGDDGPLAVRALQKEIARLRAE